MRYHFNPLARTETSMFVDLWYWKTDMGYSNYPGISSKLFWCTKILHLYIEKRQKKLFKKKKKKPKYTDSFSLKSKKKKRYNLSVLPPNLSLQNSLNSINKNFKTNPKEQTDIKKIKKNRIWGTQVEGAGRNRIPNPKGRVRQEQEEENPSEPCSIGN